MSPLYLSLVVIRTADVARSIASYGALGVEFTPERHGNGPEHYSAALNGEVLATVLEIYPASAQRPAESSSRIGFLVDSVEDSCKACVAAGGTVTSPPAMSQWGLRAVLADPDGRAVELTEIPRA